MSYTPFNFKTPEHEGLFLQRLQAAMIETLILPTDGLVHEVRITFDYLCPAEMNTKVQVTNSGFMLGGGNAG